jgi:hypothetical protein
MAVIEIDVQDFLPLGQGDVHRPTAHSANQWLSLSQSAKTHMTVISLSQALLLEQVITANPSIVNIGITDYFIMYQQGAKNAAMEYPIDIFFMWHSAKVVEFEQIVHTLSLTQSVTVTQCKAATSTLTMTHSATHTSVRPRTLTDTFTMASRTSGYMRKKYSYSIVLPTLTGPNAPEC